MNATLDLRDAAALLKLHEHTLEEWARHGRIPAHKVGRRWIFLTAELLEWMHSALRVAANAKPFVSGVIDCETVLAESIPRLRLCGIYFLILDREIVYVGQSTNIHGRLVQHEVDGKKFDRWCYVEAKQEHLNELEQKYIRLFKPNLNSGYGRPSSGSSFETLMAYADRINVPGPTRRDGGSNVPNRR